MRRSSMESRSGSSALSPAVSQFRHRSGPTIVEACRRTRLRRGTLTGIARDAVRQRSARSRRRAGIRRRHAIVCGTVAIRLGQSERGTAAPVHDRRDAPAMSLPPPAARSPCGAAEPSPKKYFSSSASRNRRAAGSVTFRRFSLMSIVWCASHCCHAGFETFSNTRLPSSPGRGGKSRPSGFFSQPDALHGPCHLRCLAGNRTARSRLSPIAGGRIDPWIADRGSTIRRASRTPLHGFADAGAWKRPDETRGGYPRESSSIRRFTGTAREPDVRDCAGRNPAQWRRSRRWRQRRLSSPPISTRTGCTSSLKWVNPCATGASSVTAIGTRPRTATGRSAADVGTRDRTPESTTAHPRCRSEDGVPASKRPVAGRAAPGTRSRGVGWRDGAEARGAVAWVPSRRAAQSRPMGHR